MFNLSYITAKCVRTRICIVFLSVSGLTLLLLNCAVVPKYRSTRVPLTETRYAPDYVPTELINAPSLKTFDDCIASWYGIDFHGKPTASGEIFDMNRISAAHKDFPLGTWIRVTNLKNNRSIIVRVNDRGPFIEGRVLDLSMKAAEELGYLIEGLARVRIEVLRWGGG